MCRLSLLLFYLVRDSNPMSCIHDRELKHDLSFAGLLQFAHDQIQPVPALGDAEFRLHFIAFARFLDPTVPLLSIDILGRSTQFWTNHRDLFVFAKAQVFAGSVSLIAKDALGPAAKPAIIRFALFYQQAAFAKVVPADFIDKGITIFDTDRDLGAKFDAMASLAADDWSDMRLRDADNAIIDPMLAFPEHLLLLQIQNPDRRQFGLFQLAEFTMTRHRQQGVQTSKIQTNIFELLLDRAAHLVVLPFSLFDDAQKRFTGILQVHLGFLKLASERFEHFGDVAFQDFPGLIEQGQIGRIADVLWRTGRIQNQGPVVVTAFFGRILLIVVMAADAAEDVVNPGNTRRFDPLAKIDKGGSTDRRCWLEFREAQKVLNVGVLGNRFGTLTIAKVQHGLHEQATKCQSGRFGDIALESGKFAGIFLFNLVPGDDFSQLDPAIVGVQLSVPRGYKLKDANLILLFLIHYWLLRSAGFASVFGLFPTIYYTIFRRKCPVCRPLRFVEQALCIILGIAVNPVIGWSFAVLIENFDIIRNRESRRNLTTRDKILTVVIFLISIMSYWFTL